MKIGYFGTPEHSAKLLDSIIKEGYEVVFVATNLDKPVGRGNSLTFSPVKKKALENNIQVLQYANIRTESSIAEITSYDVDIYIVFAYGYIIPREIFIHPKMGTINLHGSLLPKYRGASPIQSSILNGDVETGATIQYITEELDAGNIVSQVRVPISMEDNFGTLLEKITTSGTDEVLKLLRSSEGKLFSSIPQEHSKATHCKKIKPEDRKINFSNSAEEIMNRIRAFNPGYICFAMFREKRINIYSSKVLVESSVETQNKPGYVHLINKKTFGVECGDSKILILESLQPENKKVMSSLDFINGSKPQIGEFFL